MNETRKLGRKAVVRDSRTLQLAPRLRLLPTPPSEVHWGSKVTAWQKYANDRLGDCTCAAVAHIRMAHLAEAEGTYPTFSDTQVISLYSAVSGYDPSTGENDDGAVVLTVLKYWRKKGFAGQKIDCFAHVDPDNSDVVKQAIYVFGDLYLGVALPNSAKTQTVWDVVSGTDAQTKAGGWGGHAINAVGYDDKYVYFISWGALMKMTWAFFLKYVDEAWAVVSDDWVTDATNVTPVGQMISQLRAEAAAVA